MKTSDPKCQFFMRTTRQMLGLSQENFAKLFQGYTPACVKNWESGRTEPRGGVILRLFELRRTYLKEGHQPETIPNHDG
jgi:predicted transcriptional regulator